ncbi:hypothetical protein BA062_38050 [Prauserella flavalba]|uniref:Uncharacterized protein n=1 Tax=Prauserella flavalba TaxID=1477506 RepID=A0A318LF03_9PSEU|nr:hypothetical protein BA062_38050 [Prauserella flavalba]
MGGGEFVAELAFDVAQLLGEGSSALSEFADPLRGCGSLGAAGGIGLLDATGDLLSRGHR